MYAENIVCIIEKLFEILSATLESIEDFPSALCKIPELNTLNAGVQKINTNLSYAACLGSKKKYLQHCIMIHTSRI